MSVLFQPEGMCFILGAGISYAPPSSLPLADALKEMVLQSAADAACVGASGAVVTALADYPLEVILEAITEGLPEGRDTVAWDTYSQGVGAAEPNVNHRALAALITQGAYAVTTNQDPLLESALAELTGVSPDAWAHFDEAGCPARGAGPSEQRVLHLHGVVHLPGVPDSRQQESLRALLWNTSTELTDWRREQLHARVRDRAVVVIGYRGSDFDVLASLYRLQADCREVVWVHFGSRPVDPKVIELQRLVGPTRFSIRPYALDLMHSLGLSAWDTRGGVSTGGASKVGALALRLSRADAATALATACAHVDRFGDAVAVLRQAGLAKSRRGLPRLRMAQALKGLFRHREALHHARAARRASVRQADHLLRAEAENLAGQIICSHENMHWRYFMPRSCETRLDLLQRALVLYEKAAASGIATKPSFRSDEAAVYHNIGAILLRFRKYQLLAGPMVLARGQGKPLLSKLARRYTDLTEEFAPLLREKAIKSWQEAARLYQQRGDIRQTNALRVDVEGYGLSGEVVLRDDVPLSFTDLWANQKTVKAKGEELAAQAQMDEGDWTAVVGWREAAADYESLGIEPLAARCRLMAVCAEALGMDGYAAGGRTPDELRRDLDVSWRRFVKTGGSRLYHLSYRVLYVRRASQALRQPRA
jgi:hypothetical protein